MSERKPPKKLIEEHSSNAVVFFCVGIVFFSSSVSLGVFMVPIGFAFVALGIYYYQEAEKLKKVFPGWERTGILPLQGPVDREGKPPK